MLCPCHSGKQYRDCCELYHKGALPETAEILMRSRYAAYALHDADYIMETTHRRSPHYVTNKTQWRLDILKFCHDTRFEGLEIMEHIPAPQVAFVMFKAILKQNQRDASFVEKSRFEKVKGRWFYVGGEFFDAS